MKSTNLGVTLWQYSYVSHLALKDSLQNMYRKAIKIRAVKQHSTVKWITFLSVQVCCKSTDFILFINL